MSSAKMKSGLVQTPAVLLVALLGGCFSINQDIEIAAGETVEQSQSSVNGSIRVGADAVVNGDLQTVNGGIELGAGASAHSLETVNGKITLAANATGHAIEVVNGAVELGDGAAIESSIESVNGRVRIASGARVAGRVETVNGQIRLDGAEVGSIENTNGGIIVGPDSVVHGQLRVRRARGVSNGPVTVEIHAGSRVVGPLVFEREVNLRIHETAEVGEIRGAKPEYFSQ